MSLFKRRWQLHQLKKEFADYRKSIIKEKYKECDYDIAKCRVAIKNAIMEDCKAKLRDGSRVDTKRCATDALPRSNMRDHVIYDIPGYQETSNPDYLSYANATNINTTDRQEIRSENSVRRSASYRES
uniref:Expressed conserved protein n=1 Tax=Echinococcus granulosus TaxID=6210 RepID=A0A068WTX6_ECHGR|nr:hypothetical protein EgrG_000554400 [Echinococcus granulosus]